MTQPPEDSVVSEIRAVRKELSARFGDDVNALCDFLTQQEQQHADRLVNRPAKTPQTVRTAGAR